MDLYIQIGIILAMAGAMALLLYFYSINVEMGLKAYKSLDKPTVNYSMDSSISSPTFLVDSRVFTQWAINAKSQRRVFLVYPNNIAPSSTIYGAYLHQLDIGMDDKDPSYRDLHIRPQAAGNTNNAFFVNDQKPKTIDYLTTFSETAKLNGRNKMITVYTFTDESTSELIYLCYIK